MNARTALSAAAHPLSRLTVVTPASPADLDWASQAAREVSATAESGDARPLRAAAHPAAWAVCNICDSWRKCCAGARRPGGE